jgi:hypothetical protein
MTSLMVIPVPTSRQGRSAHPGLMEDLALLDQKVDGTLLSALAVAPAVTDNAAPLGDGWQGPKAPAPEPESNRMGAALLEGRFWRGEHAESSRLVKRRSLLRVSRHRSGWGGVLIGV